MRKRIVPHKMVAIILSLVLAVSVLPTGFGMRTVQAADATLYIGKTVVTDSNAADVLGDGTVSYDAESNTLTLTNAALTDCKVDGDSDTGIYAYGIYYHNSSGLTLNLVLNGTNTITANTTDAKECYGIYVGNTNTLQIQGSGTLCVTAGDASEKSVGIAVDSLIMNAGTVKASAGASSRYESAGIYSENDITVTGGSLEGTGNASASNSYGIYTETYLDISGGTVTGTGGSCSYEGSVTSVGIRVGSTTNIKGGTVTASGGTSTTTGDENYVGSSYGFLTAAGNFHLEGGTLTCTGGEASTKSAGMHAGIDFYITDGILTATGGNAPTSYGASCNGTLYVKGGENTTLFGNTQAYKEVNPVDNTYGATGCTLSAKAGADADSASATTLSDDVLSTNNYVNIVAKMAITKVESTSGGSYTITPSDTTAVAKGTTITITPTPWNNYQVAKIEVKGSGYNQTVAVSNNTFKMPGYPVSVTVTFEKIPCNHQPGPWMKDASGHQRSCSLCLTILDANSAHSDSNNDKKCDICSYDLNTTTSSNTGGSSSNTGGTSTSVSQKKPYVKLSTTYIPLQVGKSTTAVKITKKYPSNDKVKSYKSSDTKIATVNSKGKVTAKKPGKAKITVTMKSGAKAKYTVKVQKNKVLTKSITLNKKSYTLTKGKTFTIKATRSPITATDKILYKSSNKKVATVNSKGKITAKGYGKATITAMAATNGKVSASKKMTIKVIPKKMSLTSVTAGKKKLTVKWKKDTTAKKYYLQYSTDKNFKKNVKTITIPNNKSSYTIKNLKKGKRYYVRICAYNKYKGNYSNVKNCKVK